MYRLNLFVFQMHYTHNDIPRPFRVPFGPWVIPIVGILLCILLCIFLLMNISKGTGIRLGILMALGHIFYFSYGFWRSKVRSPQQDYPNNQTSELTLVEEFTTSYPSKTSLEIQLEDKESMVVRF